ncbi:MAG: pro-sigmaK processing inhibitor BofA family protein [Clostridia bacterium]|nr:pro-sigmaK processing inhibitor BofA family protein [Clostridia bacterium]
MENPLQAIGILCMTALLLCILCLRYDPQKAHARIIRHSVVGLLLLYAWNLLPLRDLGVNPLSAAITGALGLPGLGLTAVLNLIH